MGSTFATRPRGISVFVWLLPWSDTFLTSGHLLLGLGDDYGSPSYLGILNAFIDEDAIALSLRPQKFHRTSMTFTRVYSLSRIDESEWNVAQGRHSLLLPDDLVSLPHPVLKYMAAGISIRLKSPTSSLLYEPADDETFHQLRASRLIVVKLERQPEDAVQALNRLHYIMIACFIELRTNKLHGTIRAEIGWADNCPEALAEARQWLVSVEKNVPTTDRLSLTVSLTVSGGHSRRHEILVAVRRRCSEDLWSKSELEARRSCIVEDTNA